MRHASLFTGIGGFELAAQKLGWINVFMCENNPFCREVLQYHFPHTKLLDDVTKENFNQYAGQIDILTGGFPCQPFSSSGLKKGRTDERYLWGHFNRAIKEIKPHYIVAENVSHLLTIENGLAFESICSDLENRGYDVQPIIIAAAGADADFIRQRLFIVAKKASDPSIIGLEAREICKKSAEYISGVRDSAIEGEYPVNQCDYGISCGLACRTIPKWRRECIVALGNVVIPQVVERIFRAIEELECY